MSEYSEDVEGHIELTLDQEGILYEDGVEIAQDFEMEQIEEKDEFGTLFQEILSEIRSKGVGTASEEVQEETTNLVKAYLEERFQHEADDIEQSAEER